MKNEGKTTDQSVIKFLENVPAPTVATDNSGELKDKIEFIKACFQIYVGHDTTKQLEEFLKFSKFEITRKS